MKEGDGDSENDGGMEKEPESAEEGDAEDDDDGDEDMGNRDEDSGDLDGEGASKLKKNIANMLRAPTKNFLRSLK